VLSGDRLLFIDPHERYFHYHGDRTSGYAWHLKRDIRQLWDRLRDQFAPFCGGICGTTEDLLTTAGHYPGTLFRFPLRCSPSELSQTTYSRDRLEALLDQFESDARLLLTFLHSVESIELLVRDDVAEQCSLRFRVCLSAECHDAVRRSRGSIVEAIKHHGNAAESVSTSYLLAVDTEKYTGSSGVERRTYRYWVNEFYAGGKVSTLLTELCNDPAVCRIPLVGTAIDLDGCNTDGPNPDTEPSTLLQDDDNCLVEHQKNKAAPSYSLECYDKATATAPPCGQVFCFLPLAMHEQTATGLPVHVNGHFAVSQNRQHLKWPSVNQSLASDPCLAWNHSLITELIPQSYTDLLMTATCHLSARQVYAAIPNVVDVDEKWQVRHLATYYHF